MKTPRQGTPSENRNNVKYTESLRELVEAHSNPGLRSFLLLLECVENGVDRVIEQISSLFAKQFRISRF